MTKTSSSGLLDRLPPLFSFSFILSQHGSLTPIGQKNKASNHSLGFTRDTRNRDREELRSDFPVDYLNNRSQRQKLRSTPGQALPIALDRITNVQNTWFPDISH